LNEKKSWGNSHEKKAGGFEYKKAKKEGGIINEIKQGEFGYKKEKGGKHE